MGNDIENESKRNLNAKHNSSSQEVGVRKGINNGGVSHNNTTHALVLTSFTHQQQYFIQNMSWVIRRGNTFHIFSCFRNWLLAISVASNLLNQILLSYNMKRCVFVDCAEDNASKILISKVRLG